MAITLTSQTAPTSPTLPRSAAQVIFDNNYAKLTALPLKQRLVVMLLGAIYAQSGTIDYTRSHPQMIQDTKVFMAGLSTPIDYWAVLAAQMWTIGKAAVPGLSADISGLLADGGDLLEQSEEDLIREVLFVSAV